MSGSPDMQTPLMIGVGAVLGALSRYYLTNWAARWGGFPYGTFIINLSGSALIGCWSTVIAAWNPASLHSPLVAIGFLGAYTTFSTYALDSANLIQANRYAAAFGYWAGSMLLGLLGLLIGANLAQVCLNLGD